MHTVTLEEAKERLGELVEEALHGGEVFIVRADQLVIKLVSCVLSREPSPRYPLRGSVLRYERPTDPVEENAWEADS